MAEHWPWGDRTHPGVSGQVRVVRHALAERMKSDQTLGPARPVTSCSEWTQVQCGVRRSEVKQFH
jgi:hypothetical protein